MKAGSGSTFFSDTPWNTKGRCGPHFIGDDKKTWPAECNPNSRYHCCRLGWNNTHGYCGVSKSFFCECDTCIDYRSDNYTLSQSITSLPIVLPNLNWLNQLSNIHCNNLKAFTLNKTIIYYFDKSWLQSVPNANFWLIFLAKSDINMVNKTLFTWSCSPTSLMVEYIPSINGTKRYGQAVVLLMSIFKMFGIPTSDMHLVDEHEIATNVKPHVPGPLNQPIINALYQGDFHIMTSNMGVKSSKYLEIVSLAFAGHYVFGNSESY